MAAPPLHRRTAWIALSLVVAYHGLCGLAMWQTNTRDVPGLVFFDHPGGPDPVGVVPMTPEAEVAAAGLEGPLFRLRAVNGVRPEALPGAGPLPERVRHATEGRAVNTFVVRDRAGEERQLDLRFDRARFSSLPTIFFLGLAYHLVGLVYFGFGLLVYAKRPDEKAAPWLLALGLCAAVHMAAAPPEGGLGRLLGVVSAAGLPLYGPISVRLALSFTGVARTLRVRRLRRAIDTVAILGALGMVASFEAWSRTLVDEVWLRVSVGVVGLQLVASVTLFLWICWQASRPNHAPASRQRARVIAWAAALSFGVPSLQLLIFPFVEQPPVEMVVPNLVFLGAFPVLMGLAILRYGFFDLRIALRRGAVYAVLSVVVSLVFVGVVVVGLEVVGARARSPASLWVASFLVVVSIGVAQFFVQRGVERWARRKQSLYARAVEEVAEDLVRVRSRESAMEVARRVFLERMGLARVYVGLVAGDGSVAGIQIGDAVDPETGRRPESLPQVFLQDEYAPVQRALQSGELGSAYDPSALDSRAEGGDFWSRFGVECVVPLMRRHDGEASPSGVLLLGPRLDGHPLDAEDLQLVRMLANQLTVAAENMLAFEQIRALKEGLEDQVAARTKALELALEELQGAEARLIESEKQAMLGRLVAGLAHEINTPLGALTSSADTLRRTIERVKANLPADDVRTHARLAAALDLCRVQETSGARIRGLVDGLAHFVSLDEAELREVDVREGIDSALQVLASDIGDRIEIRRRYPDRVPRVRADAQRLNQVFLHLLQNAVHAIDAEGRIEVEVRCADDRLEIVFRDSGRGIEPSRIPELFDFGFTTKQGRMALRLGLPVSKRTVEELGGELRVDSTVGTGTTVRVGLPARPVPTRPTVGA